LVEAGNLVVSLCLQLGLCRNVSEQCKHGHDVARANAAAYTVCSERGLNSWSSAVSQPNVVAVSSAYLHVGLKPRTLEGYFHLLVL